ncbi:MAG: hypothetical protein ACXVJW_06465 [Acidimicrobiia bacterium]
MNLVAAVVFIVGGILLIARAGGREPGTDTVLLRVSGSILLGAGAVTLLGLSLYG